MTLTVSREKITEYDALTKEENELNSLLEIENPVITITITGNAPSGGRGQSKNTTASEDLQTEILTALEEQRDAVLAAKSAIEAEFS